MHNLRHSFAARLRLACGVLGILVATQIFNGGLSLASLEKQSVQSLIARYAVQGQDFARKTQRAVRLGKPLALFTGVADLMRAAKESLPDLDNIVVTDPDGRVLHALRPSAVPGGLFRPRPAERGASEQTGGEAQPFRQDGAWHAPFVLEGGRGEAVGRVYFSFPEAVVDATVRQALVDNLRVLGLTTAGALAFLLLALGLARPHASAPDGRRALWIILVTALVGGQAAYGYYNVRTFGDSCRAFARDNAETTARLLRQDLSALLAKGVRLERLRNLEPHLGRILQASPDLAAIAVLGPDGAVLHQAAKRPMGRADPDAETGAVTLPLTAPDGAVEGAVRTSLDRQGLSDRVFEITLDSVTVGVIALLFLVEMMMLLACSVMRPAATPRASDACPADNGAGLVMRPVGFLLVFALDLVVSFIPLHVETLPGGLGLSRDMLMGLPISVEFFCVGLTLTAAGFWLTGRPARLPLAGGILLAAAGCAYSGLAPNAVHFLLARAVAGVGYGLAIMSAQSYVVSVADPAAKATGVTNLFAGVYAGTLCGGAAGAMLSERIGYAGVFHIGAAILFLTALAVLLLLRNQTAAPAVRPSGPQGGFALADLRRLFSDRDMALVMLLSILPGGLLMTGFLNYLVPLTMSRIGASQSDIGRVFMMYTLCLAYLAPVIARAADQSSRKKVYLFLAGMTAAAGLLGFALSRDMTAAVASAFVLGLASSLCLAAQNAFALSLRVTQEIGESRTMGVYNLSERLGQVLGPILLAWAVAMVGMTMGLMTLGAIFATASLLLLWLCRGEPDAGLTAAERVPRAAAPDQS